MAAADRGESGEVAAAISVCISLDATRASFIAAELPFSMTPQYRSATLAIAADGAPVSDIAQSPDQSAEINGQGRYPAGVTSQSIHFAARFYA